MRVVSLLPSATEIVHALGHGSELVGRSEECDFPASVRDLPIVMRARSLDRASSSEEIDRRVQRARGRGESLYELDLARLRSLAPDLLLTQDLCGVCSVTDAEVADACRATGLAPEIVSLAPRRLGEVWDSVEAVGSALGDRSRGRALAGDLRSRTAARSSSHASPRVAVVEWLDPPILAGLWAPEMVERAGGRPMGPAGGSIGQRTTWEDLGALGPDLIVLAPCSFPVDRTLRELGGKDLSARVGRVRPALGTVIADEAYFSRPGPRLADGVELLASLVNGRRGSGPMPVQRWAPPAEVARP